MAWLVRLSAGAIDELEWMRIPGGAAATGTAADFAQTVQASGDEAVVLLLSAGDVLATTVRTPVRNPRQLQQALPFLVEESLAADIDRMHIVAGARAPDGTVPVVAVDREWLAGVLAALAAEGIEPAAVRVDASLIAADDGRALAFIDGADSFVACDGVLVAAHEEDLPAVLGPAPGEGRRPLEVLVGPSGSTVAAGALASALAVDGRWEVTVDEHPATRLSRVAERWTEARAARTLDLRQGALAAPRRRGAASGFNWRPLAVVAACWAIVWLGYQAATAVAHGRAADALREQQVAFYRELFPGANQVPDPRRQMQGRLGGGTGGGNDFLRLVSESSSVLAELDDGQGRFGTRSLGWEAAQGQLRMDVVARSLDDLERLRERLEARGLRVEVGSGVAQDGGYRARISLGGGA